MNIFLKICCTENSPAHEDGHEKITQKVSIQIFFLKFNRGINALHLWELEQDVIISTG
tara:strand:- start:879 stop:1052 length:174 start_codon:yes stop_codon:yes gene_type:complete